MITIGLIFAKNRKWYGFLTPLIMSEQKVNFSHCAVAYITENDIEIYHSTWPKSHKQKMADFYDTYKLVKMHTIMVEDSHTALRMKQWLEAKMHRPYSILQLVAIMVGTAFPNIRKKLFSKNINGEYEQICSELMAEFMKNFFDSKFEVHDDFIDLKMVQIEAIRLEQLNA